MRLLITTQVVDENDPILGFFCRWLTEFGKHFKSIEVICLKEGEHHLPGNVHVHSLGKEKGQRSRLAYSWIFGQLIWALRKDYDAVFVHMNPEYLILGGLDWRLMGKKIALWYNHPHNDLRLWLAALLAHKVFYTSPYSATAKMPHAIRMPAGIDTELFKRQNVARNRRAFYMQGRIMPSKHIDVALEALRIAREKVPATLTIVGPENEDYGKKLRVDYKDLIDSGAVTFIGPKPNQKTPALYSAHGASINLASAGHFDKSALESMACETPVIVSSRAFAGLASPEWIVAEDDAEALARAIEGMCSLPDRIYADIGHEERDMVMRHHGLSQLATELVRALS
jgi:glycosyltransferase involved in cell wall biosynthesis